MYVTAFIRHDINSMQRSNAFTSEQVLKASQTSIRALARRQKRAKRHLITFKRKDVTLTKKIQSIRFSQMLASTSYNGEALTSQPRSSRGSSSSGMDLSYVTERIISVWFPSSTNSHSYRQGQRQAAHMLTSKHGDNYMVSGKP